jgi:hypothetical protein
VEGADYAPALRIVPLLMLSLALVLLSLAVLIGVAMAIRFLGDRHRPSRTIAAIHGLLGASGLSALILALASGTGTGDRYGTASFGSAAAILAHWLLWRELGSCFSRAGLPAISASLSVCMQASWSPLTSCCLLMLS